MAQSFVIGLLCTFCVRNKTSIIKYEFLLLRLPQHSDTNSNNGIGFTISIRALIMEVHAKWIWFS